VIQNYSAGHLPTLAAGGVALAVNDGTPSSGAFVSLDASRHELWVTLNQTVNAALDLQITP
jgi:hypothetical protein